MLVIISDLHLTDGTSGTTISADAFRAFAERLNELAYNAAWRADGRYQPPDCVHLVLLGDVFDPLRSTHWLQDDLRPWHDPHSPAYIERLNAIVDGILFHNAEAFAVLRSLHDGARLRLPPADARVRPAFDADERIPISVKIYYLLGNHDWYFGLPGAAYDAMRQKVIDALGLENTPAPFVHSPEDWAALMEVYHAHKTFARHGDIFDPMNYDPEKGRIAATLGDALTTELVTAFPVRVQQQLGGDLPQEFVLGLRELTNIRPALLVPTWVQAQIRSLDMPETLGAQVKQIWNEMTEIFLQDPFVRSYDKQFDWLDNVDVLEMVLKISQRTSIEALSNMLIWANRKLHGVKLSFAQHALKESAFLEGWANHIIYGHTHHHEIVPLNVASAVNGGNQQVYFNSGTWHSVHDITILDPNHPRFVGYQVLTHLAFFKDDERKGRPFESWSGTLAWQHATHNLE